MSYTYATFIIYFDSKLKELGYTSYKPKPGQTPLACALDSVRPNTAVIKIQRGKVLHKWANVGNDEKPAWLKLYTLA